MDLYIGTFVKRYKRFFVDVELDSGEVVTAHCANTGSMKSLLLDGAKCYLQHNDDPKRKLKYTLVAMLLPNGAWVCANTHLPNKLVVDAIEQGVVEELNGFENLRTEVKYGEENSRIDILLERGDEKHYVEVKNVTYIPEFSFSMALFPDAVSTRGAKHLKELKREVEKGNKASMFYLLSRTDAEQFGIAANIDSEYKKCFDEAVEAGIQVLAYRLAFKEDGNSLSFWVESKLQQDTFV